MDKKIYKIFLPLEILARLDETSIISVINMLCQKYFVSEERKTKAIPY